MTPDMSEKSRPPLLVWTLVWTLIYDCILVWGTWMLVIQELGGKTDAIRGWFLFGVLPGMVIGGVLVWILRFLPRTIFTLLVMLHMLVCVLLMNCLLLVGSQMAATNPDGLWVTILLLGTQIPPCVWLYRTWKRTEVVRKCGGMAVILGILLCIGTLFMFSHICGHNSHAPSRYLMDFNKLRQIAIAMIFYAEENGHYPPAYTVDAEGRPLHSWRVLILPYLEQQGLYDKIRLDEPWDSEWNSQFHDQIPYTFRPASRGSRMSRENERETFFHVVVGERTMFPPGGASVSKDEEPYDGNQTVLVVTGEMACWMDPLGNIPYEKAIQGMDVPGGIRSYHSRPLFITLELRPEENTPEFLLKRLCRESCDKEL